MVILNNESLPLRPVTLLPVLPGFSLLPLFPRFPLLPLLPLLSGLPLLPGFSLLSLFPVLPGISLLSLLSRLPLFPGFPLLLLVLAIPLLPGRPGLPAFPAFPALPLLPALAGLPVTVLVGPPGAALHGLVDLQIQLGCEVLAELLRHHLPGLVVHLHVLQRDLGHLGHPVQAALTLLLLHAQRDALHGALLDPLHEVRREAGDLVAQLLGGHLRHLAEDLLVDVEVVGESLVVLLKQHLGAPLHGLGPDSAHGSGGWVVKIIRTYYLISPFNLRAQAAKRGKSEISRRRDVGKNQFVFISMLFRDSGNLWMTYFLHQF